MLAEYDGSNNLQRWFAYGNYIDEVLIMSEGWIQPQNTRLYIHDHLYSPAALTTYMGVILERYEYDAYGNCTIWDAGFTTERQTSNYGNPYLFTGRRVDILDSGSLKIQYNRNRYYDYYTGRWLTHDPLGYIDSMNLYEYASSNPVITIDPSGLSVGRNIRIIRRVVGILCTGGEGPYLWRQVEAAWARLIGQCAGGGLVLRGGNPHIHCVWSCKLAKEYGKEHAEKCGLLKEDVDWAIADWADSIRSFCWDRMGDTARKSIAAWVCSAYQLSDLEDNAAGRDCGIDECLKCKYATCKDCCAKEKKIPPGTREGPKHGRDWSPRCTGRYLKEML